VNRKSCQICTDNDAIAAGDDSQAIARLRTGYVKLARVQYIRGYTTFAAKRCVQELHELEVSDRALFMYEMAEVAHSVWRAFSPRKLNYELLGNGEPHLHWHLFPRYETDAKPQWPVWSDAGLHEAFASADGLPDAERDALRLAIMRELRASEVEIEKAYC
jgi:diadenosine tetraphosphate (Ap4A) HIT family hydrolase